MKMRFAALIKSSVLVLVVLGFLRVRSCNQHMEKLGSGYCFEQERWLTNEEIHNVAISHLIEVRSIDHFKVPISGLPNYANVDDFRRKQPNCCRDVVKKDASQYDYPLFGGDGRGFEYSIGLLEEAQSGDVDDLYITAYSVGACGNLKLTWDYEKERRVLYRGM